MSDKCELCTFNNPKGSATAIVLRDGKILLLKRREDPFRGLWDLPGGFLNYLEFPERALARELKEELGTRAELNFIAIVPGTGVWKNKKFAVTSFFYLADLGDQKIKLNKENSSYRWVALKDLDPKKIAFDSNRKMASLVKDKFNFDLKRAKELIRQLDSSARLDEHSLYKAVLNGRVEKLFDGNKLIGMGWIFPRQTALRKQAVVEDMIVDESYRGRGLGRLLLEKLVKWASKEGMEMIELTSSPKRIAANELYKKFGFKLHPTNHYLYKL